MPRTAPDLLLASSPYGAPLGRPNAIPVTPPCKVSLRRVRLNSGGYDQGGAYWGVGRALYWAGDDDGLLDLFFRAVTRESAKAHLRTLYPAVRFYR